VIRSLTPLGTILPSISRPLLASKDAPVCLCRHSNTEGRQQPSARTISPPLGREIWTNEKPYGMPVTPLLWSAFEARDTEKAKIERSRISILLSQNIDQKEFEKYVSL
jgi:hypothetical protein